MEEVRYIIDRPVAAAFKAQGVSKSEGYRQVAAGLMTRPISVGKRAKGLPRHEGQAVLAARVAGLPDDDIRALVVMLHDARLSEFDVERVYGWIRERAAISSKAA